MALVVVPVPLVSVLFERGAANADDTAAIALAVAIYGLGLPAFVLQKIMQPVFFAREDTKRPFHYAVLSMIVNAILAIGLAPILGWYAPAIATTVAAWVMVLLLWQGSRIYGDMVRFDDRLKSRVWRMVAASIIMGCVLWIAAAALYPILAMPWIRAFGLLLLVLSGCVSYFAAGQLLGAFSLSDLKASMRRTS